MNNSRIFFPFSMTAAIALAVCACTSAPSATDADDAQQDATVGAVSSEQTDSAAALVDQRLADAVPSWDPATVARAVDRPWTLRSDQGMQMAAALFDRTLSFDQRLPSGRLFYTDAERTAGLQLDELRGFFKFTRHMPASTEQPPAKTEQAGAPGATSEQGAQEVSFSSENAKAALMSLVLQFGVPQSELDTPYDADFAQSPDGKTTELFAHHVRVERKVNGIKVDGSRVMATFTLSGTPFRVECNWHPFVLTGGEVRTRARVLEDLNQQLAADLKNPTTSAIEAELRYVLQPNGEFEPVLAVWFWTDEARLQAPVLRRYSLIRGLLSESEGVEPGVDR